MLSVFVRIILFVLGFACLVTINALFHMPFWWCAASGFTAGRFGAYFIMKGEKD